LLYSPLPKPVLDSLKASNFRATGKTAAGCHRDRTDYITHIRNF